MAEALEHSAIRVIPLGGLSEIGLNCLAIEQQDGILIIDCGSSFPHDDYGVDLIHPDFTWLSQRADRISGVFLTHGHEDHIGGLPYLLSEIDVDVWGPPHALGLVRHRLAEHDFEPHEYRLHEAVAGNRYRVGPFTVEPIRVSHSIVEATALSIETRAGTVVHTGDFNLDPDPPDGEPTDAKRLQEIGDRGVRLLLSDSTNVDVADRPGSERQVAEVLDQLVSEAQARVVVVMFASNIQRLMMLGEIAQRTGRKLCLLGRSLNTQSEVATRIKRLKWPSDLLVSPEVARDVPRNQLLILAGGSQAERNSAMRRLASDAHQCLELEAGDSAIFSARIIPGNERGVFDLMCDLLRKGVRVHSRVTDPGVHTSGHAGRSEQEQMLKWTRPQSFMPIHGTLHHLLRHAELARKLGIKDTLVVETGTPVRCEPGGLFREPSVSHGRVSIAHGGERLSEETLRQRVELGRSGLVSVAVVINGRGAVLAGPEVSSRGIPGIDGRAGRLEGLATETRQALVRAQTYRGVDVSEEVRRAVRRRVADLCGARPVVEVQILRVP